MDLSKNDISCNDISQNYIECRKNILFKNMGVVWKSLKINKFFWTSLLISIIIITQYSSDKSYINSFVTFILAMLLGWYIHYLSHAYDLLELYENASNPVINLVKSNEYVNTIIRTLIIYTIDFHDKIHHNSEINKSFFNIFWEFFQNTLMEGGFLILLANYLDFKIKFKSHIFKFNKAILLLWGLLYASVHNINYIILGCDQHVNHHIDPKTNYGIDLLDILFDTKFDLDNIEYLNHGVINVLIITLIIVYFKLLLD